MAESQENKEVADTKEELIEQDSNKLKFGLSDDVFKSIERVRAFINARPKQKEFRIPHEKFDECEQEKHKQYFSFYNFDVEFCWTGDSDDRMKDGHSRYMLIERRD